MKLNSNIIEYYTAKLFGIRNNYIIPNVSWGFDIHECDLLVISSKSNYVTEVEIKISLSDLRADFKKRHNHNDSQNRIKYLYFAMPEVLISYAEDILPKSVGLIEIKEIKVNGYNNYYEANFYRKAEQIKNSRALTDDEVFSLLRLGCMRVWNLKYKIIPKKKKIKQEYTLNLFNI